MSQIDKVSWAHLTSPRIYFYVSLAASPTKQVLEPADFRVPVPVRLQSEYWAVRRAAPRNPH